MSKNIIITGASAGIGLALAKVLVERGHHVWGTSRELSRLPQLPNFHPVELNLNQPDSVQRAFEQIRNEAGRLDVLINNAGYGYFGSIEELPSEVWHHQFEALVFAPLALIRRTLPVMREQGGGLIMNISSLASRFPIPFMGPYNAAKAAMVSFTQALRLENTDPRIHIVDVQPGDVRTPFHDSMRAIEIRDSSPYSSAMRHIFNRLEEGMKVAPPADKIAPLIADIINQPNPKPVYRTGGFFQTVIAPLGARLGSTRMMEHALRWFYGLKGP